MKRDLLCITDFSRADIESLLNETARLKKEHIAGVGGVPLAGKAMGMLFKKPSTRTRISFEVGMAQLGGYVVSLSSEQIQMNRGETVADTARIFSRYLDGLIIRTFDHSEVTELAREADIPVVNALTDKFHPCQILADLFTITEKLGGLKGVKVAYIGDGNNVTNSWLLGAATMGMNLAVATPVGYEPDKDVVDDAMKLAGETGATIELMNNPAFAAKDADVLYTDTWISMGQEEEAEVRREAFKGFELDDTLIDVAKPETLVMHCLPAHRGEEISAEAMDGPRSIVWDQAENRLHVQKAILLKLMS